MSEKKDTWEFDQDQIDAIGDLLHAALSAYNHLEMPKGISVMDGARSRIGAPVFVDVKGDLLEAIRKVGPMVGLPLKEEAESTA